MNRPLVLASTSPWRKQLLERLGLPFIQVKPSFVEACRAEIAPREVAKLFAVGKAKSVGDDFEGHIIIGSDQVLEWQGRRLIKPTSIEEVEGQLTRLVGGMHFLHTAVAVYESVTGRMEVDVHTVSLTMRLLSAEQIRFYAQRERPVGCVGGYRFEGLGVSLFTAIEGGDESAIVGLPLMTLTGLLLQLGIDPLAS